MKHYELAPGLSFTYLGPPLDQGPLPALFYFSLSAEDSLTLAPFNTPVTYLTHLLHDNLRIFSMTIPGHENNLPKEKAIEYWIQKIREGVDPIFPFIRQICDVIDYLLNQQVIVEDKIVFSGLSRGGYIATLVAAKHQACNTVLGFAPLTEINPSKGLEDLIDNPLAMSLSLPTYLENLIHTKIRYYIGNRDTRVGTKLAFEFITNLADLAYEHRAKEGSFELIIYPSTGFMGHGTPDEIFKDGCLWIQKELGIS
jgi:predicted esterase